MLLQEIKILCKTKGITLKKLELDVTGKFNGNLRKQLASGNISYKRLLKVCEVLDVKIDII